MKKYKVTIIGAGDRGRIYANVFKKLSNVELLGVCDILEDRAMNFVRDFGFRYKTNSYKDAIDREQSDIVVVATPAYFHSEISVYAMEKGNHVISEKPMELTIENAKRMIKASEKYDRKLAIGLQYPNRTTFNKIKKVYEDRMLGEKTVMRFIDWRALRPKLAMHDVKTGNAGPMNDMSCHFVDLMRWFFNSDPVKVYAKYLTYGENNPNLESIEFKAPDTALITVEYESGDLGHITLCWGLPSGLECTPSFEAFGPKGMMPSFNFFDNDANVIVKQKNQLTTAINLSEELLIATKNAEMELVKSFLNSIENDVRPQRDGNDALLTFAVALAAMKSSNIGREVLVKDVLDDLQAGTYNYCIEKKYS